MRMPLRMAFGMFVLANLIALSSTVFAQEQYTLTPSLSVSETYDDNIYLDPENERSDYITVVTPGIQLDLQTQRNTLQVSYAPSIARYSRDSENDTVRHLGRVTYHGDATQNLKFDLTDTYRKSEDPLEETPGIETIRTTRNTYQRNEGEGRMSYLFGPENRISAGYRNYLLINEDPAIDDGTIHEPFADLVYYFDMKHGMGLSYRYTVGTFTSDDATPAQPDYTGHNPEVRYLHRFDPQTSGYVSYAYTTRDFDTATGFGGFREDYDVHTVMVGGEKIFSPQTSVTAGLGYFTQEPETSEGESGIMYNAYLRKTYQRGRFLIGGAGGWDEQYLEAQTENRGFVEYRSAEANGEYRFFEPLSGYAATVYREDMYQNDIDQKTWRASAGLRWAFHRYVSVAFDYTHVRRRSDIPADQPTNFFDEYDDNRVMIVLTGSKPYKWQ